MKFCVSVGIRDVITCAQFGEDRLRGVGVASGIYIENSNFMNIKNS